MRKSIQHLSYSYFLKTFLFTCLLHFANGGVYAQQANKFLYTWYIYQPQSSFKEVEPYKDIIRSLSVFGNPPAAFINQCHDNNIELYHAVSGSEKDINTPQKIDSLIKKYVEDCSANQYDGIDMDFEALKPSLRATYSEFLEKLSAALHAQHKN